MKLAEALIKRADLKQRIAELEHRLRASAKIQLGDNPPENPDDLLEELTKAFQDLELLIIAIDHTNAISLLEGKPLVEWLTKRNMLQKRRQTLLSLIDQASMPSYRVTKTEIRYVSTLKVPELIKEADELAKCFRELDIKLQAANWATELITAT